VTWVKFCGCTSAEDAAEAVAAGADAIGVIFAPSPRRVDLAGVAAIAAVLPERVEAVGVFVDPQAGEIEAVAAVFPRMIPQFSGGEPPAFVARYGARAIKAIHVGPDDDELHLEALCERYAGVRLLFDTKVDGKAGGTGRTFPWERVAAIARRRDAIVSGGLDATNVAACVRTVRPYGVDVRSGIERDGRKDPAMMLAFRDAVRSADAA